MPVLSHHVPPRRAANGSGPRRPTAPSGANDATAPGAHHLAAVEAGLSDLAIVNPAAASPRAVSQKQCNDCHILDRNYQRDDRENPYWVRSQGVGWIWSRCNTESGGAFGCSTCHDPHRAARATTTAQYEAKCLACHPAKADATCRARQSPVAQASTKLKSKVCTVDPARGCIKCHMPSVRMDSSRDLTDHYIRFPASASWGVGRPESRAMTASLGSIRRMHGLNLVSSQRHTLRGRA